MSIQQANEGRIAVKLNEELCSTCCICSSLCPFEALKRDTETGKMVLEIDKCQVCGLCYSSCPAKALDIIYYDIDSLTRYLENARQETDSKKLVIICKGSAPEFTQIERLFGITEFIPLSVPCVGRIPDEIFIKVLTMGIERIYVLACDEDYCRFDRGSTVTGRKIYALNLLLEQLGYGKKVITLKRNSLKVKVDADSCITCGNCVYFCPYDAAKLNSPGVVQFDLTACHGCGLCVAMCPAQALELENWEEDRIYNLVSKLASEIKKFPKILVFRCQWASFPSLNSDSPENVRFIELPCASRVDTLHILEAFQKGIDGVLVAACTEEDCKQEKASGKAQHSVEGLIKRLGQIGLQDKLHFCTVAPRYPDKFTSELEQFSKKIEEARSKESKV